MLDCFKNMYIRAMYMTTPTPFSLLVTPPLYIQDKAKFSTVNIEAAEASMTRFNDIYYYYYSVFTYYNKICGFDLDFFLKS